MTGNTDDHLCNHGFLHAPGRDAWRLSPAFDVNPDPAAGPRIHATSIDGSDAPSNLAATLAVAKDFRLTDSAARQVITQVADAVAGWEAEARSAGIGSAAIAAMAPAFDQHP